MDNTQATFIVIVVLIHIGDHDFQAVLVINHICLVNLFFSKWGKGKDLFEEIDDIDEDEYAKNQQDGILKICMN